MTTRDGKWSKKAAAPYGVSCPDEAKIMVVYNQSGHARNHAITKLKHAFPDMVVIECLKENQDAHKNADYVLTLRGNVWDKPAVLKERLKFARENERNTDRLGLPNKGDVAQLPELKEGLAVHCCWSAQAEDAGIARAAITAGFKWIGASPDSMDMLNAKHRYKKLCQDNGLSTAPFTLVDTMSKAQADANGIIFEDYVQALAVQLLENYNAHDALKNGDIFVKSSYGGGGRGTTKVAGITEGNAISKLSEAIAKVIKDTGRWDGVYAEQALDIRGATLFQLELEVDADQVAPGGRLVWFNPGNQKVVEIGLSDTEITTFLRLPNETYEQMRKEAEIIAKASGYDNRGTAELLIIRKDGNSSFYHSEFNCRLQVENRALSGLVAQDAKTLLRQVLAQLSDRLTAPLQDEKRQVFFDDLLARLSELGLISGDKSTELTSRLAAYANAATDEALSMDRMLAQLGPAVNLGLRMERNSIAEQVMRSCGYPVPAPEDFSPAADAVFHVRLLNAVPGLKDWQYRGGTVVGYLDPNNGVEIKAFDTLLKTGIVDMTSDPQQGCVVIKANSFAEGCEKALIFLQNFVVFGEGAETSTYLSVMRRLMADSRFINGDLGCNQVGTVLTAPFIPRSEKAQVAQSLGHVSELLTNGYRTENHIPGQAYPSVTCLQAVDALKSKIEEKESAGKVDDRVAPWFLALQDGNLSAYYRGLRTQLETRGGGLFWVCPRDTAQERFSSQSILVQHWLTRLFDTGVPAGVFVGKEGGGAQYEVSNLSGMDPWQFFVDGLPKTHPDRSLTRSEWINSLWAKTPDEMAYVYRAIANKVRARYGVSDDQVPVPWIANNFHAGNHRNQDISTKLQLDAGFLSVPNWAWDPRYSPDDLKGWVQRQYRLFKEAGRELAEVRIKNAGQRLEWTSATILANVNVIRQEHRRLCLADESHKSADYEELIIYVHNHNFNHSVKDGEIVDPSYVARDTLRQAQDDGYRRLVFDCAPPDTTHNNALIVAEALTLTDGERAELKEFCDDSRLMLGLLSRFDVRQKILGIKPSDSVWAGGTDSSDIDSAIKSGMPLTFLEIAKKLAADVFGLGTIVTPYSEWLKNIGYAIWGDTAFTKRAFADVDFQPFLEAQATLKKVLLQIEAEKNAGKQPDRSQALILQDEVRDLRRALIDDLAKKLVAYIEDGNLLALSDAIYQGLERWEALLPQPDIVALLLDNHRAKRLGLARRDIKAAKTMARRLFALDEQNLPKETVRRLGRLGLDMMQASPKPKNGESLHQVVVAEVERGSFFKLSQDTVAALKKLVHPSPFTEKLCMNELFARRRVSRPQQDLYALARDTLLEDLVAKDSLLSDHQKNELAAALFSRFDFAAAPADVDGKTWSDDIKQWIKRNVTQVIGRGENLGIPDDLVATLALQPQARNGLLRPLIEANPATFDAKKLKKELTLKYGNVDIQDEHVALVVGFGVSAHTYLEKLNTQAVYTDFRSRPEILVRNPHHIGTFRLGEQEVRIIEADNETLTLRYARSKSSLLADKADGRMVATINGQQVLLETNENEIIVAYDETVGAEIAVDGVLQLEGIPAKVERKTPGHEILHYKGEKIIIDRLPKKLVSGSKTVTIIGIRDGQLHYRMTRKIKTGLHEGFSLNGQWVIVTAWHRDRDGAPKGVDYETICYDVVKKDTDVLINDRKVRVLSGYKATDPPLSYGNHFGTVTIQVDNSRQTVPILDHDLTFACRTASGLQRVDVHSKLDIETGIRRNTFRYMGEQTTIETLDKERAREIGRLKAFPLADPKDIAQIGAPFAGQLAAILAKPGDIIDANRPIAVIYSAKEYKFVYGTPDMVFEGLADHIDLDESQADDGYFINKPDIPLGGFIFMQRSR